MRNDNEKVAVPVVNGVVPLWAEYKGGMRGYDEYGRPSNEVFFVGIIDILTEFGLTKKAENFLKSFIHSPVRSCGLSYGLLCADHHPLSLGPNIRCAARSLQRAVL